MAVQLVKLAAEGRAFDATRPFTEKEHEAVLTLMREGGPVDADGERSGMQRIEAATYVRNGITTVEAYDKAVEANFEPKSLESIQAEAVKAYQEEVAETLGIEIEDLSDAADGEVNAVSDDHDAIQEKEKGRLEDLERSRKNAEEDKKADEEEEEVEVEETETENESETEDESDEEEEAMPDREALEKEANDMGVEFSPRIGDETLWKRIKEAKDNA